MTQVGGIMLGGTERDNGVVDREWADEQLGLQYELHRRNGPEGVRYTLGFWPQFTDPEETRSSIGFSDRGVDALLGPICHELDGPSPDATFEAAEMSLRFHLATAPAQ